MNQRSGGFTLVELLVAVALSAGAIVAVATMSLSAYSRVVRSGELTSATGLAQQRIEWLRSQSFGALTAGTITEHLDADGHDYVRTTLIEDGQPLPGIKEVTVSIDTPSGRTVRLSSRISG